MIYCADGNVSTDTIVMFYSHLDESVQKAFAKRLCQLQARCTLDHVIWRVPLLPHFEPDLNFGWAAINGGPPKPNLVILGIVVH